MIRTEIKGDLGADLDRYLQRINAEVLKAGAGAMAAVISKEVEINASRHVKTGTLLSAVYQYHADKRSTETVQTYYVGVNRRKAPHFHLLEYGTSRAPAYPIVRPALDHIQRAIEQGRERMTEKLKA